MNKMTAAVAACVAAMTALPALAGGPATPAAETAVAAAPAAAGSPWTGFWGGLMLGQSYSNYDISGRIYDPDLPDNHFAMDLPDFGGNGSLGGATLGYNRQIGDHFVLGLEADLGVSNLTTATSVEYSYDPQYFAGGFGYKVKQQRALLLRAGYLVTPGTLIYGLAGLASTRGTASLWADNGVETRTVWSSDLTQTGATLGIGMETLLNDHVSLKVDFRSTVFNRHSYIDGAQINDDAAISAGLDTGAQTVTTAIVWHF